MAQQAQKEELTLQQIDQSNPVTRGSTALVYKKDMTIEEDAEKACRQKMPQQTAVEWLLFNLELPFPKINEYKLVIELAKQMEKEQIIEAHNNGKNILPPNENGEQYYNETFGKE